MVATDDQYKEVCKTNISLIAGLPAEAARTVLRARLEAQRRLPPDLRARDEKVLNQAIKESPYASQVLSLLGS
ncbi:MAG: hypothetical protein ACP5HK_02845 [Acidilobus sp.]